MGSPPQPLTDKPPVAPVGDGEARLLPDLPAHAVLGALARFELAADAQPLVLVDIVFLLGAVEHQILLALFQIAECG